MVNILRFYSVYSLSIKLFYVSHYLSNYYVFQNDIIGPAGYGDAHFISPLLRLDYKIRFENHPNATAPAQRVFIRTSLDDDLDIRSFRVGDYGFTDFTQNVTMNQAILQVMCAVLVNARVEQGHCLNTILLTS